MNVIYVLIAEDLESPLTPSTILGYNKKAKNQEGPHQNSTLLVSWSWTSQSPVRLEKQISVVYKLPHL